MLRGLALVVQDCMEEEGQSMMSDTARLYMESMGLTEEEAVREDMLSEQYIRSGAFDESWERHKYADRRTSLILKDYEAWKKDQESNNEKGAQHETQD